MADEYDDELPPITVNFPKKGCGPLVMPSAEALATQRARELACERELRLLRAHTDPLADSSGSEGEVGLAMALGSMEVEEVLQRRGASTTTLSEILPPLLEALPPQARLVTLPPEPDEELLEALTEDVIALVSAGAVEAAGRSAAGRWAAAGAAAWLGGAALCPRAPPAARRALHRLLDSHLFQQLDEECARCVRDALLSVAGCARGAGGARGAGCAERAVGAADAAGGARSGAAARLRTALLLAAAGPGAAAPPESEGSQCACAWRDSVWEGVSRGGAGAGGRGAGAVRAAGRVLRACTAPAPCAPPPAPPAPRPPPAPALHVSRDKLEVLVGASKLQLLFRD